VVACRCGRRVVHGGSSSGRCLHLMNAPGVRSRWGESTIAARHTPCGYRPRSGPAARAAVR
jgi:hypothetical protein